MDPRREFILRIDPKHCTVMVEQATRGITRCKEIDPSDLYDAIIKNTYEKDRLFSGMLPQGCLSVVQTAAGRKYVVLEYPHRHADISYYSQPYKHFPLPKLVFGFWVEAGGKVLQAAMGVVKDGQLTPETPMFFYPFSNVRSNSTICMGANVLPTVKSLTELTKLADDILKMPNNDDFFDPMENKLHLPHEKLLEHLKDKGPGYYDDHVLVPSNKTLGNFLSLSIGEVE